MQTLRSHTPGFVLMLLVLATLVVAHQTPVRGAKAADDVNIVNTPLPVTGAVSINGTPSVNISGIAAVNAAQSGPWTVGLAAGTTVDLAPGSAVAVNNGVSNPIFTRPAGTPLQLNQTSSFGGSTVAVTVLGTVPGGTMWVIEHVSAQFTLVTGSKVNQLSWGGNGYLSDYLPAGKLSTDAFGFDAYQGSAETKMYLYPGQMLVMYLNTDTNQTLYLNSFASGYAVPYP